MERESPTGQLVSQNPRARGTTALSLVSVVSVIPTEVRILRGGLSRRMDRTRSRTRGSTRSRTRKKAVDRGHSWQFVLGLEEENLLR